MTVVIVSSVMAFSGMGIAIADEAEPQPQPETPVEQVVDRNAPGAGGDEVATTDDSGENAEDADETTQASDDDADGAHPSAESDDAGVPSDPTPDASDSTTDAGDETDSVLPTMQTDSADVSALDIGILAACAGNGGFEIDGNFLDGDCGTTDWANVPYDTTDGIGTYNVVNDNSNPDNWVTGGGTPPKIDFSQVYAYAEVVNNNYYLNVGWERDQTSGTGGYVIEVTRAGVRTGPGGVPRPDRSQGGVVFYITTQGSNPPVLAQSCRYTSQADYPGTCSTGTGGFAASINDGPIESLERGVSVQAGGFLEVGFNATLLAGVIPACPSSSVATAYMRSFTGSNAGPTGNLKGWVAPMVVAPPSTCGSLTIKKHDEAGNGLAGASFAVTPNPTTGTGSTTVVTGIDGAFSFSQTVVPGTYTVTETIAPAGYLLPSEATQNITIAKEQAQSVTFIDPLGSVSWLKHDQDGDLLGGATFVVTATGGDAAAAPWDLGSSPLTVVDNTGQPGYTGLDTDPTPGAFAVVDLPTGTYSVSETVAPEDYDLDATAQTFTISDQMPHPTLSNAFVNTLSHATLTLVKEIAFGDADASAWELSATGPNGSLAFAAGVSGVSGQITPNTAYILSEDDPLPQYRQSGEWVCVDVTDPHDPQAVALATPGVVVIPPGDHYECTVTNTTAKLTILKVVEGDGDADPATWNVGAIPDDSVPALPTLDAPGSAVETVDNTWEVRPDHPYDLVESFDDPNSQIAYLFDRVEHWDAATSTWVDVTDFSAITVAAGVHETYRFVNKPAPRVALPLTGGLGSDLVMIGGSVLVVLAGGSMLWHRRETVRARLRGGTAGS